MRVQCRRRLVEDGDARALHQHLGEPEALAHAARESRHPVPPDIGQSDPRQRFGKPLVDLAPRQSGEPPGIGEVVAGREPVVEADRIGEIADPALDLERVAQRVETGHFGAPLGRFGQPEQHQDRRRLSRPVGPEDADDLAGPDVEIDVVDRYRRAVTLGQPLGPDNGFFSHFRPHPPSLSALGTLSRGAGEELCAERTIEAPLPHRGRGGRAGARRVRGCAHQLTAGRSGRPRTRRPATRSR